MSSNENHPLLNFESPLLEGIFLNRYKRFFADIKWNESMLTVHVPNSGSMEGCKTAESRCLISDSKSETRKLRYTLEAIRNAEDTCWIGVNTSHPNKLVNLMFQQKVLEHWSGFDQILSEAKISDASRVDFVLWNSRGREEWKINPKNRAKVWKSWLEDPNRAPKLHYVEVKNVSLARGSLAQFPDAVTERGQKHIDELVRLIDLGATAELLFLVQRTDTESFSAARDIDEDYATMLEAAHKKGLKITPTQVELSPEGFLWKKTLPVIL